jgi:hypothetical protein
MRSCERWLHHRGRPARLAAACGTVITSCAAQELYMSTEVSVSRAPSSAPSPEQGSPSDPACRDRRRDQRPGRDRKLAHPGLARTLAFAHPGDLVEQCIARIEEVDDLGSDRASPWRDGARCSCRCGCTLPSRGLGPLLPFVHSAERRVMTIDARGARRARRCTTSGPARSCVGPQGAFTPRSGVDGDERRAPLKACGRGARRRDRSIDGLTPSRSRPTPGSRTTSTGR